MQDPHDCKKRYEEANREIRFLKVVLEQKQIMTEKPQDTNENLQSIIVQLQGPQVDRIKTA